ncbi:virulence promoting factor [Enterobacter sp. FS01]|nr:virulence promoting factor [Enterobacter sp. FS01]
MFYNDMNKKPVARPGFQHSVLEIRSDNGLLSQIDAAIVVNCFTLNSKN